jgi:eukaryotic-like serine/threonine-protein kinase
MATPRVIDGKFELVRELGEGGMGTVFEARHLHTGRRVAVKLIRGTSLEPSKRAQSLRRFEREARAVGRIESDHVVSVLDTGVDASGDPYLVMELLRGEDLRELLRRVGRLDADLAVRIVYQACLGLQAAHDQGIVHRDIKAANLYLARRGQDRIVTKLLDFGIAKLRPDPLAAAEEHDLTRTGSVLGSPVYMAPEQAMGARDVDARADVWSLGIVLYEALCGTTPHERGALGSLILAICSQPPRSVREHAPWVSEELAAAVQKALTLDPSQRFQSADAMGRALSAIVGEDARISASALPAPPEPTDAAPAPGSGEADSPPADSAGSDQDTTADPFTLLGVRAGPRPRVASGPRRRPRALLVAVGAVGLTVAAAGAFEVFPRDTAPDAAPDAAPPTAPPAVQGPPPAPDPAPRPAATEPPPAAPSASAQATKPQRRPAPRRATGARPHAPEPPSAAVAPSEPAPSTAPSPPAESAIDRHFD